MTPPGPAEAIVTIDGPAGAGKSTAGRGLARRLGWGYLDSGALYRAVTWMGLARGVDLSREEEVAGLVEGLDLRLDCRPDAFRVWAGGEDVTGRLRLPEVTAAVSLVARSPAARRRLSARQREAASGGRMVVEGRDAGSVVFPRAAVKFYLEAAEAERAGRRGRELAAAGRDAPAEETRRSIRARDEQDLRRRDSPLRVPEGAQVVDTTRLAPAEVLERLLAAVRAAGLAD